MRIDQPGRSACVRVTAFVFMRDIVPTWEHWLHVSEDSEKLIDLSGCNLRNDVPVATLGTVFEVAFSLQTSPAGYSNGRLAMISPACAVVGIDLVEPDHVPDFTPWKAIFCNCSVSVETHSR